MHDNLARVIDVSIDEILPNRFQPRIQFDEEEILELSDSIKEHGVIQPIVVRSIGDKYEIIAGERRYKASVLAGKETVPVIVRNLSDKESAEVALIENVQRKNLTPIEEALSYKKILDMGYLTQEGLAAKLGKSQSSVANKIRLLNLSDEVQEALLENKISERHARSLLKLSTSKQQNEMLERIITERLTVRRTDEEIEKLKNSNNDDSSEEGQKIISKGENDMNNNMFGVPTTPQPEPKTFDIFGSGVNQQMQNPKPVQPETPAFDIFGGNTSQEQVSQQPAQPQAPTFDIFSEINSNLQPEPTPQFNEQTVQPVVEQPQPEVSVMPEITTFELPKIDQQPVQPAMPEMPTFELPQMPASAPIEPQVPETHPIIETPIEQPAQEVPTFELPQQPQMVEPIQQLVQPQPEVSTIPEPIIVTDYSKQYDPVMPEMNIPEPPKVDFKEVINIIRNCSSQIEQYGFKIDVEEYDLANMYQVIFKIEK